MKTKTCSFCGEETTRLFYANPKCCTKAKCLMEYKNKKHEEKKSKGGSGTGKTEPRKTSEKFRSFGYSTISKKPRKPTGEYSLFLKIYAERNATCEVTGAQLKFDVKSFAHILSKGAYPGYRLNPDNIIMVHPNIHDLYDNFDKATLLAKYPEAKVIYDKKDKLKYEYYNGDEKEYAPTYTKSDSGQEQ